MEIRHGRSAYYLAARDILKESVSFKVLAKTPTLFLVSQMKHDYQKSYLSELLGALGRGSVSIEYLFSLPQTKDELAMMEKKDAKESLRLWKEYSAHESITLRYLNTAAPFSCCIGERHTAALWPHGKRAAFLFDNKENPLYLEEFDRLFASASESNDQLVDEIASDLALY